MFCVKCGNPLESAATVCQQCHAPVTVKVAAGPAKPSAADRVKTTSKEALEAFKTFATNPVGGLSVAYEQLGDSRALGVGITFAVVSIICSFVGGYMLLPQLMRDGIFHELGLESIIKAILVAVVPFVTILVAGAVIRMIFHGPRKLGDESFLADVVLKIGADSFIAGAVLLPLAALILLAGILGFGNAEVIAIAGTFAICVSLFMVFAGYTRIYKISERLATVCVPTMIIISSWFMKIIYVAVLKQSGLF